MIWNLNSFLLQKPPSRFFIFATRKLWNYLVQVFLVGFSSFLLSDYYQRCSVKKVFLEILQNSQENTCATLLIKLQPCNFIKKESLAQVFSCKFCEVSKNTFFSEHLWPTAFSERSYIWQKMNVLWSPWSVAVFLFQWLTNC